MVARLAAGKDEKQGNKKGGYSSGVELMHDCIRVMQPGIYGSDGPHLIRLERAKGRTVPVTDVAIDKKSHFDKTSP